jgi:CHAT domain-containing protein
MSNIATPIFVKDIETAKKLIANAKGPAVVNIFVLDHTDALTVIDQLADRITVQPVKHFGEMDVYIEAPEQLTKDHRQKYIHKLAGQVFRATYEGIESQIEVTQDGQFKCLSDGKTYTAPSTAIAKGWYGKIKGRGQINGWYEAKNKNGKSITDELKKYIEGSKE